MFLSIDAPASAVLGAFLSAGLRPMVLGTFYDVLWHFLGAMLVLVSLILIFIILIQDSKGAGLTSAFGAGPGGESLLGARMQRDVARYTAILAIIFAVLVIAMGLLGNCRLRDSAGAAGANPIPGAAEEEKIPALEPLPPPPPPEGSAGPAPPAPPPGGAETPKK